MSGLVSVALPVRQGAATLDGVLRAVRAQRLDRDIELLICDSGSHDDSLDIARRHGAHIIQIPPEQFSHGETRNLLMRHATGEYVALLTQDAEPADEHWLARLLAAFALGDDVSMAYGPYRPRADGDRQTARELDRWFRSLAPDGLPRIDRLAPDERDLSPERLFGRRTFFTDANACIRRTAWERCPFRPVAYAEDHALAMDMLRAGYAKAFMPDAAVLHAHRYTAGERFRRAFDEWRGLLEIYGWRQPADPRSLLLTLRGELGVQWRELVAADARWDERTAALAGVTCHYAVRLAGAVLGSRADHLPAAMRGWLSLEGRRSIVPSASVAPLQRP